MAFYCCIIQKIHTQTQNNYYFICKAKHSKVVKCQKWGCPSNFNLAPSMLIIIHTLVIKLSPFLPSSVPNFIQCSVREPSICSVLLSSHITIGYITECRMVSFLVIFSRAFLTIMPKWIINFNDYTASMRWNVFCYLYLLSVHQSVIKSLSGGHAGNQYQNWNCNLGDESSACPLG